MLDKKIWTGSWRLLAAVVAMAALAVPLSAQSQRTFPGATWDHVSSPETLGWSVEKLRAARDYSKTIKTAAVMVVTGGRVLDEWGDTTTRFNVHSIRKSLLSAMYGVPVADGRIDLSKTMGDLGIDDNEPSLTAAEKKATVRMLLQARSGVYHAALYETESMKKARPARFSHEPGTFWYYNNWDFNALGMIFERQVKNSLFREFQERIAGPIGMQDFTPADTTYVTGPDSVYAAYPFRLTARDMARFGLLFLRDGEWKGQQVVPAAWVRERYDLVLGRGRIGWLRLPVVDCREREAPPGRESSRRQLLGAWRRRTLHPGHPGRGPGDRPPGEHRHPRQLGLLGGIRPARAPDPRSPHAAGLARRPAPAPLRPAP